eukprot:UN27941
MDGLARFPFFEPLPHRNIFSLVDFFSLTSGALFIFLSSIIFFLAKTYQHMIPSFPVDSVCPKNLSHQFENSHQYKFCHNSIKSYHYRFIMNGKTILKKFNLTKRKNLPTHQTTLSAWKQYPLTDN